MDPTPFLAQEQIAPQVIDLSGGQPDLTPEWVPWMMRELQRRQLNSTVYLWSDDNLSNDYFWRYLSEEYFRNKVDAWTLALVKGRSVTFGEFA